MGEEEEEVEAAEANSQGAERGDLPPWVQHSAVISLPRFDYRTPALLLERTYSGFLITCPINREKSATKEAMSILEKFCSWSGSTSESLESSNFDVATKKRKICLEENNGEHAPSTQKNDVDNVKVSHGQIRKEASISHLDAGEMNAKRLDLSPVKLTRSGLILFTFTPERCNFSVDILSGIFHSLGSGDLKSPLWCHRIFPIQETCVLKDDNLSVVVAKLTQRYLANEQSKLKRPIRFAVGYNRRGMEQAELKNKKSTAEASKGVALLDRDQCFKVVAKAIKDVIEDSVVDLRTPEVVVLVELLPISGVAPGSAVAGVSILSHNLVTTKPRLTVKALISDGKTRINV